MSSLFGALVLVTLCAACGSDDDDGRNRDAAVGPDATGRDASDGAPPADAAEGDGASPDGGPSQAWLEAPAQLSLPYITAGGAPPGDSLTLREVHGVAGSGGLTLETSGPFAVAGDAAAMAAGEQRALTVTFTGATDQPLIASGTLTISADGQTLEVALHAVIGDPALPASVSWETDDRGTHAVAALPSAPFPDGVAPWTDPSVLVAVPPGLVDDGALGISLHLHGHTTTLADAVPGQFLLEQFALSGRNAVFIVPQGPVYAASGDFGKLDLPGGFATLVRDVLSLLYRDGLVAQPGLGPVVVSSHSGGYQAAANLVTQGGIPVDVVHLFDSLYGYVSVFEGHVLAGGRLRSIYTAGGGTASNNTSLTALLEADGVTVGDDFDDDTLLAEPAIIAFTDFSHSGCVYGLRHYARWLRTSGQAPTALAPPELRAAVATGGQITVAWLPEGWGATRRVVVQGSIDGVAWQDLAATTATSAAVSPRPWLRVVGEHPDGTRSAPSDVYGATGAEVLVVDGFDRVLGGGYREPTHDFAGRVGNALGRSFSTASNEAVAAGQVDLAGYGAVIWLLGEESTMDLTFDATERALLTDYVDGGGKLLVSGAELGYATDAAWLAGTLHVGYVADDAGTDQAGAYTFGVIYPVAYPDRLSGETTLWSYATGGAAAVGWNGQVVAVGFGLESMDDADLTLALDELLAWLGL